MTIATDSWISRSNLSHNATEPKLLFSCPFLYLLVQSLTSTLFWNSEETAALVLKFGNHRDSQLLKMKWISVVSDYVEPWHKSENRIVLLINSFHLPFPGFCAAKEAMRSPLKSSEIEGMPVLWFLEILSETCWFRVSSHEIMEVFNTTKLLLLVANNEKTLKKSCSISNMFHKMMLLYQNYS